ncbi:apolipoprotein N-acyltransferase [Proteobacteria bacterium 005FR1]|nr:apolipoprotein N-acyltransferase [Proteobacteria bacterium 005FR1]
MSLTQSFRNTEWRWPLLALLAGALLPLSFAPYDLWPVALLSLVAFSIVLDGSSGKQAFWRSWFFGVGMYGTGASWVFVSIYQFGNVAPPLAVLMTGLFVVLLASIFALPFIVIGRWFSHRPAGILLGLPAVWVFGEWLRSWLFTGFPWLYLGYGHLESWLAGWAPVAGVMGVSLVVAFTASAIAFVFLGRSSFARGRKWLTGLPVVFALAIWLGGYGLKSVQWTRPYLEPVKVGIVQGNIPQERKWDRDFLRPTLERYFSMSEDLWDNDWVIWPEAAIPLLYHQALPFIDQLQDKALDHEAALITGVLYDRQDRLAYYNSIIAIGLGAGIYHKQRLVPFGDYVPLREYFGPILSIFDLPMSVLEPGPDTQRDLQVAEALIAPSICYEVAYPDTVAENAAESSILITISNDAWFGASIGPLQHMQIAQMRALETGRYLIRATNNGVSALVNSKGEIIGKTAQFVQATLEGEVELRQGLTPFMRWGSEPVLFLSLLLGAAAFASARRH